MLHHSRPLGRELAFDGRAVLEVSRHLTVADLAWGGCAAILVESP